MTPHKISITGLPGSGKTTLSVHLNKLLNLPIHHLDRHLFFPGGIKRDKPSFRKIQEELVTAPEWIIEGCGTSSLEVRYAKSDLFIYLNPSRWLCLWRLLKRFLFERSKHPDTPVGCQKVFTLELIRYTWTFHKEKGPGIYALKEKYPDVPFKELNSPQEIFAFIQHLKTTNHPVNQ